MTRISQTRQCQGTFCYLHAERPRRWLKLFRLMQIWWFILWSYRLLFSWRRPTLYVVLETIIIHWIKICVNRHSIPSDRPNSIPGRFDTKFWLWGPFHWSPVLRVRRRTAYPRPCCTCTLSPGSFRTFPFTLPGHSGRREDSVCLPSQPWLSVFFCFPWIVSREPSYSVVSGKQVNAVSHQPL